MRALRLLPLLISGGMAILAALGTFTLLDNQLRDIRFGLETRAPSGSIVLVEIDPESLDQVGVWPWPRSVHATLVTSLIEMDAWNVAFDIDFSQASTEIQDASFEAALEEAGGYVMLAAFRQLETGSTTVPIERFARHAELVGVNVSSDNLGVVRQSPSTIAVKSEAIPSLAVALGGKLPPTQDFLIDYSIDPRAIDRISAADVLARRIDPERVRDKQVVIGATALELRDVMMTPNHGVLPGGLIQIMAAESVLQDRALAPPNPLLTLALIAAVAVVLLVLGRGATTTLGLITLAGVSVGLEGLAFGLQSRYGVLLDTSGAQLALWLGVAAALAIEAFHRRRLHLDAERARIAALERLAHKATYDDVTGVFTRFAMAERIDAAVAAGKTFEVISIRLDRLERINGALGRQIGDEVLKAVAERVTSVGLIVVGRVSEDGLAVLVIGDEIHSALIRRRLRVELDRTVVVNGHELFAGCRIGFVDWSVDAPPATGTTLLQRAEIALSAGAARSSTEAAYQAGAESDLEIAGRTEIALRHALELGEIDVHLQGQVDLHTGLVSGAEALARWTDPSLGIIPPSQFVALAEQTGLAVALGAQVLNRACRAASYFPPDCRIAVNVSAAQFELDDIPVLISDALARSGIDAHRLDIEITEGVFLASSAQTVETLEAIKAMGVGIALDDFGTGFSSLQYLAALPIDKLKIDQSFVRRIGEDRRTEAIIEHVIGLCRSLSLKTVAEGIETKEQAEWLTARGCDVGQGYYFHRPAELNDFLRMAAQRRSLQDEPRRKALA